MEKKEFDKLVGIETDPKCYERIEFVYMNSDKFQTKQEIAEFYKEKDMNGIEAEYREITEAIYRDEEFKIFVSDLAYYARDLNSHIKQHLADTMHQIFRDKTVVKMLSEYRERREKEFDELTKKFEWSARYGEKQTWGASCLTHSDSYKEVIAEMTYNEWWHEHADDFQ